MQAQPISAQNTSSSDSLIAPSGQDLGTAVAGAAVTFDTWTIVSPRLAAIKEVSANIAGEIPAYERYVAAKNEERGLDIELYVLRDLNHTPSAFNFYDKVQEALEKRAHDISLAA